MQTFIDFIPLVREKLLVITNLKDSLHEFNSSVRPSLGDHTYIRYLTMLRLICLTQGRSLDKNLK
jgi:hypothetical protein